MGSSYIALIMFVVAAFFLTFSDRNSESQNKMLFLIAIIILTYIAGYISPSYNLSRDYLHYLDSYNRINANIEVRFEPTFVILSKFVKRAFDQPIVLFVIYAIISLVIKLSAIKLMSTSFSLSLIIFLGFSFMLHEMTQIRVGVASGLMLLGIHYLFHENRKMFLLMVLLAFLFHYTSLVMLVFLLFDKNSVNVARSLLFIVISYALAIANIGFGKYIELIPFQPFHLLLDLYKQQYEMGEASATNIFNGVQVMRIIMCLFFIFYHRQLTEFNQYIPLLIKVYVFSIVSLPLFNDLPVISFRINELLSIVEIIIVPALVLLIEPYRLSKYIPFAIGLILFLVSTFYVHLLMLR